MAKKTEPRVIIIPPLKKTEFEVRLVGDRPLMVSNKLSVIEKLDRIYGGSGGKASAVAEERASADEQYAAAFYVMPDSKYCPPDKRALYGIPTSGIKKCATAAIRMTGISDNTTVGLIGKSFFIMSDGGGLSRLHFKKLERDIRGVNIGSGQKTVPQLRHRPMFHDWYVDLRISFNNKILSPEQIINLLMHAGQYIGYGEMRAQKNQGECGGFIVEALGKTRRQ